jgi:hypothetical protein
MTIELQLHERHPGHNGILTQHGLGFVPRILATRSGIPIQPVFRITINQY